jgi:hypothetical protein
MVAFAIENGFLYDNFSNSDENDNCKGERIKPAVEILIFSK